MNYEERLNKIAGSEDPFWNTAINNFVEKVYKNKEEAIKDLELLATDKKSFNEFTKRIIQEDSDLVKIKEEFMIYRKNIIISFRFYNGVFHKGSIYNENIEFELKGKNARTREHIRFCENENVNNDATLDFALPFCMNEAQIDKLKTIVEEIETKYEQVSEKDKKKETSDFSIPKFLKYTDLTIDGKHYEIDVEEPLLVDLLTLIKVGFVNQSLSKAYEYIIKVGER